MPFYSKNLRDDEQIIAVIRRHWLTNLPKYILTFILFFIPFFFMFPLFNWGTAGQIIFSFLLAIAVFYLLKLISFSYFNCLVITTQRLIDFSQEKTLERQIREVEFPNIIEVGYKVKGLLQIISKSGNLEIRLASSPNDQPLVIRGISQPEKIQNLILDLKKLAEEESLLKSKQGNIRETYQEILSKIKKDIGQDGLERLLKSLDDDNDDKAENNKDKDLEFLKQ